MTEFIVPKIDAVTLIPGVFLAQSGPLGLITQDRTHDYLPDREVAGPFY